jgi:hypothetical protein
MTNDEKNLRCLDCGHRGGFHDDYNDFACRLAIGRHPCPCVGWEPEASPDPLGEGGLWGLSGTIGRSR